MPKVPFLCRSVFVIDRILETQLIASIEAPIPFMFGPSTIVSFSDTAPLKANAYNAKKTLDDGYESQPNGREETPNANATNALRRVKLAVRTVALQSAATNKA